MEQQAGFVRSGINKNVLIWRDTSPPLMLKHLLLLVVITPWTTILGQKGVYYPVAVLTFC